MVSVTTSPAAQIRKNTHVTIGLVAVPERKDLALACASIINAPDRISIFYDIQRKGSWFNTRRAWLSMTNESTHHIALEEDTLPCKDFLPTVELIASLLPDKLVVMYSGKIDAPLFNRARKKNHNWFVRYNTCPSGVCVMMPRAMVSDFLKWADRFVDPNIAIHEDEPLWGFLNYYNIEEWHMRPSIVEHIGQMRSALGYNNKGKTTPEYIGANVSGLSIDWAPPSDPIRYDAKYINPTCLRAWVGPCKTPLSIRATMTDDERIASYKQGLWK